MSETIKTVCIPGKPEGSYEVRIGCGILPDIAREVEEFLPGLRPFVVTDANLDKHGYTTALTGQRIEDVFVIDPPGECSKTFGTVEAIVGEMELRHCGRDTVILALGGGTVGDIAGFAAAIFKRGIPCVQIPTTTVAQADSAVGGKVGVDSGLSKNAYGAFHHPVRVYMDCGTLQTLDDRHFRAGLVESVKHAMIADASYFDYIEENMDALLRRDEKVLQELAERNCAVKGDVVFEDPREKNLRRVLNYGHTIGHAIEMISGFSMLHGEAVAVGIIGACRIAEEVVQLPPEVGKRARGIFERLGVPVFIPAGISVESILETMKRDKKAVGQVPRFVLLKEMGVVHSPEGVCAMEVPAGIVEKVLSELGRNHVQTGD